jgi:ribosomal peptide maturation radical SAM protein 1
MPRRVLLIVMPFLPLARPALGVGLLKAELERAGIPCDVRHLHFAFADCIGFPAYQQIADDTPTHDLAGEWIFTPALYGASARPSEDFLRNVYTGGTSRYTPELLAEIDRCRALAPGFIAECAASIDLAAYDIIGFSTTFQQNVASLALARQLKRRNPSPAIVFGGANCEGEMGDELHNRFQFLDVVCSGEGDMVFPELVRRLRAGHDIGDLPGIVFRRGSRSVRSTAPQMLVEDMDALPYPDHSDFIRDFSSSSVPRFIGPELTMETSRGCWWGQKHHCTFCGLNGMGMTYRSKSSARAYDEILHLAGTYGIHTIFNTDNIVDMRYFREVFPRLEERGLRLQLFYETKSNLKKSQMAALRRLGTTWFQPGIESLDSHVLALMDKGVRGIHNVQLLKWAREMGFTITWNILCGFPGERPEDYRRMARLVRSIPHLEPPSSLSRFRLDRFSPMFERAEQYGLRDVRPFPAYRLCYPFSERSIERLAYFFHCASPMDVETSGALHEAWRAVEQWQRHHTGGSLTGRLDSDVLEIADTRPGRPPEKYRFNGLRRDVYLAADAALSSSRLLQTLRRQHGDSFSASDLQRILDEFLELDLMVREDDLYLSIALLPHESRPAEPQQPLDLVTIEHW